MEKKPPKIRLEDVAYCAVIVWTWVSLVAVVFFLMGATLAPRDGATLTSRDGAAPGNPVCGSTRIDAIDGVEVSGREALHDGAAHACGGALIGRRPSEKADRMSHSDPRPDAELARLALEGDRGAYGVLVERYRDRLVGLAFHLCGDYETALDLTQDTLLAAWSDLDRLREPSAFGGWVSGILRNKFRNLHRSRPAGQLSLDVLMEAGFEPPAPEQDAGFAEDEVREVVRLIGQLPDKYRETLVLRYSGEHSYKEIAEVLEIPVSTVTTRLNYGRKLLLEMARKAGLL